MNNYTTIETIKQKISILDFFRRYVGEPQSDGSGSRYKINCPLHEDNDPSLKIWPDEGKWKCFGCNQSGDIFNMTMKLKNLDIKGAISLLVKDFNLKIPPANQKKDNQISKKTTVYDYTDAGGNLIYQVIREDIDGKKRIRQRRPDGKDGWIWNLKGVESLPYRLPELLKAIENDDTIYIAEGELCVNALSGLELPATTNSNGAGKWTNNHNKYFPANTTVIVLPDNDTPGRSHSQKIAKN